MKAARDRHAWQQGQHLLQRLRKVYTKDAPLPAITESTAILLVLCFTFLYIAPFYLSQSLRSSTRLSRNSPQSIKARTRSVWVTCFLTTCIACYVLLSIGNVSPAQLPTLFGLQLPSISSLARVQCLVTLLFLGPVYEHALVDAAYKSWFRWRTVRSTLWSDWIGYRNLIVGPVSEEYIFRGLATSLFLLAHIPAQRILYLGPVIFGLAHVHHFNEAVLAGIASKPPVRHTVGASPNTPGKSISYVSALFTPGIVLPALLGTLLQFSYTTVFGVLATFVLLRTGNLWACVVAHAFCNWLGLPRFWGRLEHQQDTDDDDAIVVAADVADSTRALGRDAGVNGTVRRATPQRVPQLAFYHTVVYYVLLVGGVVAFYRMLWPLTASEHALASI